jgi:SAM-dependent methyltransferase
MGTLGARLEQFIAACSAKAYTEPPDNLAFHAKITQDVWDKVKWAVLPADDKAILDIGCANGFAQAMFAKDGIDRADYTGITCSEADAHDCGERGIPNIFVWDMHNVRELFAQGDYENGFDLVWARHVMEHSPIPLFLLQEIRQILTPGTGKLYVEVPAPDTACRHTTNPNHFSCFGREGWEGLFDKAGFTPIESFDIEVKVPVGNDRYYCWLLGLK